MSGLRLDVEDWYPFLEPETFATTIIPLTYREAQAVLHAADDVKFKVNDHLTGEDKDVLAALALKLDAGLSTWKSSGAFVRLSKRSPKDAALRDPRLKQYIAAEMEAEPDDAQTPASKGKGHVAQADIGKAIIAITRAVTKLACIHSGTEAIDMLVRSQRRIYPDLTLLLLQQSEAEFNENIILREFVDLRPEMEFRAFIHQGQMTGLTQYNSLCYVPEVAGNHEALGKSILAYWDTRVRPLVPPTIPSYVCDFAFVKTPEGEVLKTIELNPFGECTHACLFDWKKDRGVLENGPFEMRVVRGPVPEARARLAPELRAIVDDMYPPPSSSPSSSSSSSSSPSRKGSKDKERDKHCIVQ